MNNLQFIPVPFNGAFDIHPYIEGINYAINTSGDYFLPPIVLDDFEQYQSGVIYSVSGSGINGGFWNGSGIFNSKKFYYTLSFDKNISGLTTGVSSITGSRQFTGNFGPFYDANGRGSLDSFAAYAYSDFESMATGFFSGNKLTGEVSYLKYNGPLLDFQGHQMVASLSVYFWESFEQYTSGANTGYFNSGFFNYRNYSGKSTGFNAFVSNNDSYLYDNFQNYTTGFNTGKFNSNVYIDSSHIFSSLNVNSHVNNKSVFSFENFELYNTGIYINFFGNSSTGQFGSGSYSYGFSGLHSGTGVTVKDTTVIVNQGTITGYFRNSGTLNTGLFGGYGVYTNASSGYFYFPHTGSLVVGNFTLEMWVYRSGLNTLSGASILDKNIKSGLFVGYSGSGNNLVIGVNNVSGFSNFTVPTGIWTYIGFQRSGTSGIFYSGSGKMANSFIVNTGLLSGNDNIYFGDRTTFSTVHKPFVGRYDEIRLWNYARSNVQMSGNFSGKVSKYQSGLLLYYTI